MSDLALTLWIVCLLAVYNTYTINSCRAKLRGQKIMGGMVPSNYLVSV